MNEIGVQGVIQPPGIYWSDDPEYIAARNAAQKAWADQPVVLGARNAAVKAWEEDQ